jgi:hypothetical protein
VGAGHHRYSPVIALTETTGAQSTPEGLLLRVLSCPPRLHRLTGPGQIPENGVFSRTALSLAEQTPWPTPKAKLRGATLAYYSDLW